MPLVDLPGAIGPTYKGIAPAVAGERCVNLIPEKVETEGKTTYYYTKAPGLSGAIAMPAGTPVDVAVNGTVRGQGIQANGTVLSPDGFSNIAVNGVPLVAPIPGPGVAAGVYINGRRFFIVNDALWELTGAAPPFSAVNLGSVGPVIGPYVRYSIGVNIRGNQLAIASNNRTSLFDLTTNTFYASVSTPEPLLEVDELDGYFIGLAASGNFYISGFQDGTSWDPLDFAFEQTPDLTMAIKVCNRRIMMFGSNHIESYVDSGDPNFPFTRDQSVYVECGAYRNSLIIADNMIYGIAVDARGAAWAFRLAGVTPQRISTHAVETSWQSYATVRDVAPRAYQENGHTLVCFNFPGANKGWGYDISTGLWHERGVWNDTTASWERDWGEVHIYDAALELHLVGDYRNSSIYIQGQNYYDFAGTPIYWMRRFPHVNSDQLGIVYDLVRLICQTGVNGTLAAGVPATITLAKSEDGGYTFTAPVRPVSIGSAGAYNKRIDWRALGRATDRVFEISGHDPIPLALIALKGQVRPCFN
jgi:hypothetical protein